MNKLNATIVDYLQEDHLLQVRVSLADTAWHVLLIDSASARRLLDPGREVHVLFKESAVTLSRDEKVEIGIQNKLSCKVKQVRRGELLSQVTLQHQSHDLTAIVPTAVMDDFGVTPGDELTAWIRANELILES
ncbi:MAG: TOBE domain-containing protein [Saprospiraceae bacterium]|nr:TOBE domain-containing protein [Saprospiraceae bacterium]MCB9321971.1 TOBE domain-containing protein [Lewinellaceae bacterium]